MTKTITKAQPGSYRECPACSEEEGEEVFYHKSQLRHEEGSSFFLHPREEGDYCPRGHKVPAVEGESA